MGYTHGKQRNPLLAPRLLALPAPTLVISKSADGLDDWSMKERGQPWKMHKRNPPPGSYVGWIGLMITTCGKVISVDRTNNRATVEWYNVEKMWCRTPPSSLCRWSDLYPAYECLVKRVVAPPQL